METQIMGTQNFWQKNQALITAVAGAVAIVLQQFITQVEPDFKAIGLAVLLAIAGVVGREYRGKGVTVAGFIGVAATALVTVHQTGNFTWFQFLLTSIIGFLALVAPPPKSEAYERTTLITDAKQQATEIKTIEKEIEVQKAENKAADKAAVKAAKNNL
jgi:hypothetical protein